MVRLSSMKSGGSAQSLPGMYLINDCGLRVYNLSWDNPTIFRPLGQPNDEGTDILSWRDEEDPDQLTGWIDEIPNVVRGAGTTRRVTFCADLPEDESNFTESPYARLVRIIRQRKNDKDPVAEGMLKGSKGAGAVVPGPRNIAVLQGCLYMHNGKDFVKNPMSNILLALSPSATQNLAGLITYAISNDEMVELFAYEGPTPMIHVARSDVSLTLPPNWQLLLEREEAEGNSMGMQTNYHLPRFVAPPAKVNVPSKEYNLESFVPWNKIHRRIGVAEQLEIIASAYDPEFVLEIYRMSEFEQYLPSWLLEGSAAPSARRSAKPATKPVVNEPVDEYGEVDADDDTDYEDYDEEETTLSDDDSIEASSAAPAVDEERRNSALARLEQLQAERDKKKRSK